MLTDSMKRNVNHKFNEHPISNFLLFLLIRDRKFLWAACCLLLMAMALVLALIKFWNVSPEGQIPRIKISGLDYIQAYSFKRQATQHEIEGSLEDAFIAWTACVANRPYHADTLRSLLMMAQKLEYPNRRQISRVTAAAKMLIASSGSESDDHLSVASLINMGGVMEATMLLESLFDSPSPDTLSICAMVLLLNNLPIDDALMHSIGTFAKKGHSNCRLMETTIKHLAGTNHTQLNQTTFWQIWDENQRNSTLNEDLKSLLGFWLALQLEDRKKILIYRNKLVSQNRMHTWARIQFLYWQTEQGDLKALRNTLANYDPSHSINAYEIVAMADLFSRVSLKIKAKEILESGISIFPNSPEIWLLLMNICMDEKDWPKVHGMASKVRLESSLTDLRGFSHFTEAYAFHFEGNKLKSQISLNHWLKESITNPDLERQLVAKASEIGATDLALLRYQKLEDHYKEDLDFWQEVWNFAYAYDQFNYLLEVSKRLFELAPNSATAASNYAAVHLALRRDPTEAIALTYSLLNEFPNLLPMQINHIHALLQNQRLEEAEAALNKLNPQKMPPDYLATYQAAWFELYLNKQMPFDALRAAESINIDKLLAPQRYWITDAVGSLSAQ